VLRTLWIGVKSGLIGVYHDGPHLEMPENDPLSKALQFLQKVKYGGVVGKKTVMTVVALIVLGTTALALAIRGDMIVLGAIVVLIPIVLFGSFKSIDANIQQQPQLALMDGTEIIAWNKAQAALKGKRYPVIDLNATPIADPSHPPKALPTSDEALEDEA
jgi:hypothetical protein